MGLPEKISPALTKKTLSELAFAASMMGFTLENLSIFPCMSFIANKTTSSPLVSGVFVGIPLELGSDPQPTANNRYR
ncbi:MAG: Uncharacterised protein [SAR116 cluster bacterium]|nr:MAG: Uncharacterised protein [SAR116 cluster bacterium]